MKKGLLKILAIITVFTLTSCYIPLNGIHENEIGVRYFVNDIYQTGWIKIDGKEYYFSRVDGYMVKTSQILEGQWYGINPDGTRANGFFKDSDGTRYYNDGIYVTGWQNIDDKKYYFSLEDGLMVTGKYSISGVLHNFNENGVFDPVNGLVNTLDGTRYYIDDIFQTGWQKIDGYTYYFSKVDGYMVRGSQTLEGKWYGIDSDGRLVTGFHNDTDGTRYYDTNSNFVTGWQEIEGKTYYFAKNDGIMATGEYTINGVTYNFSQDGVLLD